jgi:hypothetical protein
MDISEAAWGRRPLWQFRVLRSCRKEAIDPAALVVHMVAKYCGENIGDWQISRGREHAGKLYIRS